MYKKKNFLMKSEMRVNNGCTVRKIEGDRVIKNGEHKQSGVIGVVLRN